MSFFNKNTLKPHTNNADQPKKKREVFRFFEVIYRNFPKLVSVNFLYFLCMIPLFCGIIYIVCSLFKISPEIVEGIFFLKAGLWIISVLPTPVFLVLFVASLVAYGPLTAGLTYTTRNISQGKPIFASELFARAKSNLKQGIAFGFLDMFVLFSVLTYLASDFSSLDGANLFFYQTAKVLAVIISVIYFCVRFYSYDIAVTFELKFKDIIKNSLIFCVLGFFRNIIAFLIIFLIIFTFTSTPKIDVALMATLMFSLFRFTVMFLTYPIIEKYMMAENNTKPKQDD